MMKEVHSLVRSNLKVNCGSLPCRNLAVEDQVVTENAVEKSLKSGEDFILSRCDCDI